MEKNTFLDKISKVTTFAEIAIAAKVAKPTAKRVLERLNEDLPKKNEVLQGLTNLIAEKKNNIEVLEMNLQTLQKAA